MPHAPQCDSPKMIPFTPFEEYKDKYKDVFTLERTESGIVTAKWHTDGGPAYWDYQIHRGTHQLAHDIGQDADTEVFILGGTGDEFLKLGPTSIEETPENLKWALYEHNYYDGCNMVEGLVNDIEQPTIGVLNGGTQVHTEVPLLCDITLMDEDSFIMDPHFPIAGGLPGDGIQIAFRSLMGIKRTNYALMFGGRISAQQALDYGLVNEILPHDKLYDRALELGEQLAAKPRLGRRLLVQTLRLPLKEQIAKELRPTFGTELWGNLTLNANHDEAFAQMNKQM